MIYKLNFLEFNNSGYNEVINTLFLKSQLPNGVFYKNFTISPETYQPSGSIKLSDSNLGHKLELELDEIEYNKYLNNKNNINKNGFEGKIIYVTYKSLFIKDGNVTF